MGIFQVKTKDNTKRIRDGVRKINIRNLGHLLAIFRREIQKVIGKKKKPRPPGKPATSPTGQLYNSIRYAVEQSAFTTSGVIGPARADIGLIGKIQEAGGKNEIVQTRMLVKRADGKVRLVKGPKIKTEANYPARPYMQPSFDRFKPRLPSFWADALRGLTVGND